MSLSSEQYLQEAIQTLSQSDPLVKLLQQVKLGRMAATDPGLRAITYSWLSTYQQIFEKGATLEIQELRRLDPTPRLAMLIEAGMAKSDEAAVSSLRQAYEDAMSRRQPAF